MRGSTSRVVVVHNFPSPYRLPLFAELAKRFEIVVLYGRAHDNQRLWQAEVDEGGFQSLVLSGPRIAGLDINRGALRFFKNPETAAIIVADNLETLPLLLLASIVSRLYGKPLFVWTEHVPMTPLMKSRLRREIGIIRCFGAHTVYPALRRRIYKRAAGILSMSGSHSDAELRALGNSNFRTFSSTQVMPGHLLPPPPIAKERELADRAEGLRVIYVGYFRPEKGVDDLISAFRLSCTDDDQLILVGSGPEEMRLRHLAADHGAIQFAGYREGSEKARLFSEADVSVLPSYVDPWGLVVNESLYYGTPVICSREAGASQLLEGGAGLTFKAGDVDRLAELLGELRVNSDLRRQLITKARQVDRKRLADPAFGIRHFLEALETAGTQPLVDGEVPR
jgi:glycosyltransferase involved in cell wall biosynthesis